MIDLREIEFWTPKQVARYLGINVAAIYRDIGPLLGEVVVGVTRGGYTRRVYPADRVKELKRERDDAQARREAMRLARPRRRRP